MSRLLSESRLVCFALILSALPVLGARAAKAAPVYVGEYGIHLFFDEKEFVDTLTLRVDEGKVVGVMEVPNDFTGSVSNLAINHQGMRFDLLVPKNAARPNDLTFHYEVRAFAPDHAQFIGFVTIPGQPGFVASFVGFRR